MYVCSPLPHLVIVQCCTVTQVLLPPRWSGEHAYSWSENLQKCQRRFVTSLLSSILRGAADAVPREVHVRCGSSQESDDASDAATTSATVHLLPITVLPNNDSTSTGTNAGYHHLRRRRRDSCCRAYPSRSDDDDNIFPAYR